MDAEWERQQGTLDADLQLGGRREIPKPEQLMDE
jgi:hypothetical protein